MEKTKEKTLDQMNDLFDMGKFPWTVHLGASLNIVFTIWLTYFVFNYSSGGIFLLLPFGVLMVSLNVLPVILLRSLDKGDREYPDIGKMSFFSDQHRFSTWVYAIASANMFFWIVFAWWIFTVISSSEFTLILVQLFAFVVTFIPLWKRFLLRERSEIFESS